MTERLGSCYVKRQVVSEKVSCLFLNVSDVQVPWKQCTTVKVPLTNDILVTETELVA